MKSIFHFSTWYASSPRTISALVLVCHVLPIQPPFTLKESRPWLTILHASHAYLKGWNWSQLSPGDAVYSSRQVMPFTTLARWCRFRFLRDDELQITFSPDEAVSFLGGVRARQWPLWIFSSLIRLHVLFFLDASSHLYKRVCPSVRPYVRPLAFWKNLRDASYCPPGLVLANDRNW